MVLAYRQGASTGFCKPEEQDGFGTEELSQCQGALFPKMRRAQKLRCDQVF